VNEYFDHIHGIVFMVSNSSLFVKFNWNFISHQQSSYFHFSTETYWKDVEFNEIIGI